jgi:Mg-chelatase subunit ChlD
MKSKILLSLALGLVGSSIATAAQKQKEAAPIPLAPATTTNQSGRPKIEVCFVLDTTGSMGGLIEGAKQKIWSIANEMIRAKPTPEIRIGLVAFRDRGDEYVTRDYDLTNDIDSVYGQLKSFRANGGGDEPESVNEALQDAVRNMSWSQDRKVLKMIFLVGDAQPHMDYADGPKYPEVCQEAVKKDLLINTVQCGNIATTTKFWKEIAQLAEGQYAAIPQTGNMVAVATPMDAELSRLNHEVGSTLVAYGDVKVRNSVAAKQAAAEAAPASVAADRLTFNSHSGLAVQGEGELLDSLANGKVKLESLDKANLPVEMQNLSTNELKAEISKKQEQRSELQARIRKLSQEREDYLAAERKRLASQTNSDSFDEKVAATIRAEAARKGIEYAK